MTTGTRLWGIFHDCLKLSYKGNTKPLEDIGFHYLGPFRSNVLFSAILWEIKHILKKFSNLVNRGTHQSVILEIS